LGQLFSGEVYRFGFHLRPARAGWLTPGTPHPDVLRQRQHRLEQPGVFQWSAPASAAWEQLEPRLDPAFSRSLLPSDSAQERARAIARVWAPDFILLSPDDSRMRMSGGAVCFPSGWDPREKQGRTVAGIHAPVPTLNRDMGSRIDRFLSGLKPGDAMERDNWGLAAVPDLDLHPQRPVPRIQSDTPRHQIWFRLEEQAFIGLGEGHVLFLIHVRTWPLDEVLAVTGAHDAFENQIRSMPTDIAHYKGLAAGLPPAPPTR
jgi:hypothetical protein